MNNPSPTPALNLPPILAGAIWWLVPLVLRFWPGYEQPQGVFTLFGLGLVALIASIIISALNRSEAWLVPFWLPPVSWLLLATVSTTAGLLYVMDVPSDLAAPLYGIVILAAIVLCAVLLGLTAVLLWFHPSTFPMQTTLLAAINTLAISFAASSAYDEANKQYLTLHIHDLAGQPISQATVTYDQIGANWYGRRTSQRAVPLRSDHLGVVRPHFNSIQTELQGSIRHPQFETVFFTMGGQLDANDRNRFFSLSRTEDGRGALRGFLSPDEPLTAFVYLPPPLFPAAKKPPPVSKPSLILTVGSSDPASLDLEHGRFLHNRHGHLIFDLTFEPPHPSTTKKAPRLHVHALPPTGIQTFSTSSPVSFSQPIPSPERLFNLPPRQGYLPSITLDSREMSESLLFVSLRNGQHFYSLRVRLERVQEGQSALCLAEIRKLSAPP